MFQIFRYVAAKKKLTAIVNICLPSLLNHTAMAIVVLKCPFIVRELWLTFRKHKFLSYFINSGPLSKH